MKNCPYCGTLLEDNAQICIKCNAPLGGSQFSRQNPNYSAYNGNQQNQYPQALNNGIPVQPYQPFYNGYANYPQQQFYNGQQMPGGSQMPNNGTYSQQTNNPVNSNEPKKIKQDKKRGCCLPWFVVLIVLLIGIIVIVIGMGSSKSNETKKIGEVTTGQTSQKTDTTNINTKTNDSPSSKAADENVKTVYYVGDILQDGNMKIVYIASGDYKETNQFLQPKEGNKFIFLRFAFINEGDKDQSISFYSFDAYADGYACSMHYNTDETLSATLSSGRSTTGDISFEVPVNANKIEIEYTPNIFSSKKVTFVFEGDKDSGYVLEANTARTEGAYKIGDVITSNDLNITYLSSGTYISDNMFVKPKSGYHFASVELEFENIGTSDKSISSLIGFNCYADGKAYDKTFVRDDNLSGTIAPGRKIRGTVTCEVPDNAEVIELEYEDNIWTSNKIVFIIK